MAECSCTNCGSTIGCRCGVVCPRLEKALEIAFFLLYGFLFTFFGIRFLGDILGFPIDIISEQEFEEHWNQVVWICILASVGSAVALTLLPIRLADRWKSFFVQNLAAFVAAMFFSCFSWQIMIVGFVGAHVLGLVLAVPFGTRPRT